MNFDLLTFVFEVVNFIVLVWLLKRLLYKPVLAMIEVRRRETAETVARAEARQQEAEALRARLDAQLAQWEAERANLRAALESEFAAARRTALDDLARTLDEERARAAVLDARRREEESRQAAQAALVLAARFLSALLQRLAGPELEARLVDVFLADLDALPTPRREALARALHDGAPAQVASAHPLAPPERQAIERALAAAAGGDVSCAFAEAPALLAGLRVSAGALVLRANLADELGYFTGNPADGSV